jgi:hypothetical protein
VIADWDAGKIPSFYRLARRMQKEVYSRGLTDYDEFWEISRNMALNLNRIADRKMPMNAKTIELRAVRTHFSAELYLRVAELLEARLNYLASLNAPIAVSERPARVPSVAERLSMFRRYISECGLDPADYAFVLPEKWRAAFLASRESLTCATTIALDGYAGPRPMSIREYRTFARSQKNGNRR